MLRNFFLCFILLALTITPAASRQPKPQARFLSYEEARPLLQLFDEELPAELKGKSAEAQAAAWPAWVEAQDAAVRARLRRGDEDTLVNFLLFGVSFTKQPRVTARELSAGREAQTQEDFDKLINARIDDLIRALASPGANERLLFLRKLVAGQGLGDAAGRAKLREYILANLQRALREQESYTRTLAAAR